MNEQTEKTSEDIEAYRKHIRELLQQAEDPEPGDYEIKVAEVLAVGRYSLAPEVAIVRDTRGKIWAIPENRDSDTPEERRLVSRWDVRPGMKLRLTVKVVAKRIVPEILAH